jgi:hypothetical protein
MQKHASGKPAMSKLQLHRCGTWLRHGTMDDQPAALAPSMCLPSQNWLAAMEAACGPAAAAAPAAEAPVDPSPAAAAAAAAGAHLSMLYKSLYVTEVTRMRPNWMDLSTEGATHNQLASPEVGDGCCAVLGP